MKFRVYDKKKNELILPFQEDSYSKKDQFFMINQEGMLYIVSTKDKGSGFYHATSDRYSYDYLSDIPDTKGNNIYGNDIVKYTNYFDGEEWDIITKVVWRNNGLYLEQGPLISCNYHSNNISDARNLIVIGNIHQNPELLEVKNES